MIWYDDYPIVQHLMTMKKRLAIWESDIHTEFSDLEIGQTNAQRVTSKIHIIIHGTQKIGANDHKRSLIDTIDYNDHDIKAYFDIIFVTYLHNEIQ